MITRTSSSNTTNDTLLRKPIYKAFNLHLLKQLTPIGQKHWCFSPEVSTVFFFFFLQHMEVPELRVKSELQLQACTTAIAMPDLSQICDLHHSSQKRWILNPLSKARDWTCILMGTSQIHFCWATPGTPVVLFLCSQIWQSFLFDLWV